MKKIFPIIVMILVFSGFLTGQIVFDYLSLDAEPVSMAGNRLNAYSGYLQELEERNQFGSKEDSKLTILTFWASWCAPCLDELAVLNKAIQKLGPSRLKVIAVNGDEIDQERKMSKVITDLELNFDFVKDDSGYYFDKFNVSALPFTVLFKGKKAMTILDPEKILDQNSFFNYLSENLN